MSGNPSYEVHTPGRTATSAGGRQPALGGTKPRSWTGVQGATDTAEGCCAAPRARDWGAQGARGADAPQDTRDMPGGGAAAGTIAQDSQGLRGEARTGTGWAHPVGWGAGGRGEGGPQPCPHPTGLRCYLLGS